MRNRLVSLAAALILVALSATAGLAASAFEAGKTSLSAGIGFGVAGIYGTSSMPVVGVALDRSLSDVFSVGGVLGYSSSKDTYDSYSNYGWKYSYTMIGVRGSYHLTELVDDPKVDLYVGGMLGYNMVSATAFAGNQTSVAGSVSYALSRGAGHAGPLPRRAFPILAARSL